VILGRRANHRRAADIDILDRRGVIGALRHGLLERIEIDHKKVDRRDSVRLHRRAVIRVVAQRQKPAMHHRVQRFHAPVHHLGKARHIGHVPHREAGLAQAARGAPGREQLDTPIRERPAQIDKPGLVGNGKKGAGHGREIGHLVKILSLDASWRVGRFNLGSWGPAAPRRHPECRPGSRSPWPVTT
jgi:hypothetical protein